MQSDSKTRNTLLLIVAINGFIVDIILAMNVANGLGYIDISIKQPIIIYLDSNKTKEAHAYREMDVNRTIFK